MRLPLESRASHGSEICSRGDFDTTAKAIQLDAFFTFLLASANPGEELSNLCQLVFDLVAGTEAYAVREQLLQFSEIRGNQEPREAVSAILLAASTKLEPTLGEDGTDPLRSARYVLSVVELMRQGLVAVERFAVPPPARERQQLVCQEVASFLEAGRKTEAGKLEAALRCEAV